MRTVLIGLLGGALIFTYFWYRGDVGAIELGPLGEFTPPTEQPFTERLRELQAIDRAVGGEFLAREVTTQFADAPDFYAGQLIAKPKRRAAETATRSIGPSGGIRALSSSSVSGGAVREASKFGDVLSGGGGAMLISLDFDVADETEDAAPEGAAPAGTATRTLSTNGARATAFRSLTAVRKDQIRTAPRRLAFRQEGCQPGATRADYRRDPRLGVACTIDELQKSGEFEYVERNFIVSHEMGMRPREETIGEPSDPLYALQWNYRSQGAGAKQSAGGAGFVDFWERKKVTGSKDVVVAVIDTGLDMDHPDIKDSGNVTAGVDMVSVEFYANDGDGRDLDPSDPGDICNPDDPFAENSWHGTHVAGTIGAVATDNGAGVAGGAWNVTIVPVRALGRCGGLQSDINDAIRWAAGVEPTIVEMPDGGTQLYDNPHPADIINLSLGFRAPSGCPRSTQEAINDALATGAILVAAAGNAGINVDGYAPSGCDGVLTVSAGDGAGELAYYSNWGDRVDVMAPGGDMRADVDGDGRPDGVLSTKRSANCRDPLTNESIADCVYSYENGTSMAAPHVSAALALLKTAYPTRGADQLMSMIVDDSTVARTEAQCQGPCPDNEEAMCFRPCGKGLMNLAKLSGG